MAMAMSMGVMSLGAPLLSSSSSKGRSNLRQSSPPVARSFASPSSSFFSGSSLSPRLNLGWGSVSTQRSSVVKVRAGKPALGCTKRSRSRKSIARTSGFRVRLRTPGGRNILRRRRAKGRKVLCPCSNPNSGKRA